jgi:hypothetical protein
MRRLAVLCITLLLGASGCGGGSDTPGDLSAPSSPQSATAANVVGITVDLGPVAANDGSFNIPFTTVTVCAPGTSSCATINNVLVDTGSYGLRLMASVLKAAGLALSNTTDPANASNTLAECLPFADGFTWGALSSVDLRIGGESANNVPINIIDDTGAFAASPPASCSSFGTSLDTVSALGANGVLGIGVFVADCGVNCADCASYSGGCNNGNDTYYSCATSANSCAFTPVALANQVSNPVSLFAADNNGVIVQMPALPAGGAPSASGYLVFGIGTQSNNGLGSAVVLTTDDAGDIITQFNGQSLSNSFFDTGSNALYFDDSSIPACPSGSGFYCPSSTLSFSATNQGQNGLSSTASFQIADLNGLSNANFALDDVGGQTSDVIGLGGNYFDWGLPFFYGRAVFTAFEGRSAGSSVGPYYAY